MTRMCLRCYNLVENSTLTYLDTVVESNAISHLLPNPCVSPLHGGPHCDGCLRIGSENGWRASSRVRVAWWSRLLRKTHTFPYSRSRTAGVSLRNMMNVMSLNPCDWLRYFLIIKAGRKTAPRIVHISEIILVVGSLIIGGSSVRRV
jgi:hypothetical protein